jgi:type II restriction enzyme
VARIACFEPRTGRNACATLAKLHPANRNIRPKIRQQLQVLRDMGLVEFLGGGEYRLT